MFQRLPRGTSRTGTGVSRSTAWLMLPTRWWISKLEEFYSLTMTGVPSGAALKKCAAIPLGKRMHPCDAAYGGT